MNLADRVDRERLARIEGLEIHFERLAGAVVGDFLHEKIPRWKPRIGRRRVDPDRRVERPLALIRQRRQHGRGPEQIDVAVAHHLRARDRLVTFPSGVRGIDNGRIDDQRQRRIVATDREAHFAAIASRHRISAGDVVADAVALLIEARLLQEKILGSHRNRSSPFSPTEIRSAPANSRRIWRGSACGATVKSNSSWRSLP